jgi:dihydroflavonol-4-reductase
MDPQTLESAVQGVDLIFHTAGLWDGGPDGQERMRRLNVDGTDKVLRLGIPTVYTSSSITCGFGPIDRPGTEDEPSEDPQRPLQGTPRAYRETKLQAEALVREARAWMVNPDYVVGPGDVNGVVTQPLLRASRLPVIPAPRGGKCFVSLKDVASGHLLVLGKGRPGRRYLLGSENRSYADILGTLAQLRGRRVAVIGLPRRVASVLKRLPRVGPTGGALEQMGLHRYRSSERARAELDWNPTPVDDALLEMLHWSRRAPPAQST